MEEDAGKSMHDQDVYHSLIDLNRAGVPLIEIVSEPDIRTGEEAYQYISEIRKLVRYLDICDGNMEEGSLRCDANISVRIKGASAFGTKVEVKNMNSMRNVQRAIDFEIERQITALETGDWASFQPYAFNNDGPTNEEFVISLTETNVQRVALGEHIVDVIDAAYASVGTASLYYDEEQLPDDPLRTLLRQPSPILPSRSDGAVPAIMPAETEAWRVG
jgi:hypothetical protein